MKVKMDKEQISAAVEWLWRNERTLYVATAGLVLYGLLSSGARWGTREDDLSADWIARELFRGVNKRRSWRLEP